MSIGMAFYRNSDANVPSMYSSCHIVGIQCTVQRDTNNGTRTVGEDIPFPAKFCESVDIHDTCVRIAVSSTH